MAQVNNAVLSVRDAQSRILAGVTPTDVEELPLQSAYDRVLGAPLLAMLTQPPFNASAMDGYAVRSRDVSHLPVSLNVVGESAAGHGFDGVVGDGDAVRIFTGAPVPDGADAIVIQENTTRDGDVVAVIAGSPAPQHIRPHGGDFREGEALLAAGVLLGPSELTLVAAMGHGTVHVRRKPVVAILATGDELVAPGERPGLNQIVASNAVGIAAMVRRSGGEPLLLGIARDNREDLATMISEASRADVLVTIGGASVGDHDLVGPVLESVGMTLDFWKIAMRPGKPLLFGRFGEQRVIGVPGNPVSSLICARVFLVPLIRSLLGVEPAVDFETGRARLSKPLEANGPREHYMRALMSNSRGDSLESCVEPMPNQDSSMILPLVDANCLIVRNSGAQPAQIGDFVTVLNLDF